MQRGSAWGRSYTESGDVAWTSECDDEMMEGVFHALDRLERRDMGMWSEGVGAISV